MAIECQTLADEKTRELTCTFSLSVSLLFIAVPPFVSAPLCLFVLQPKLMLFYPLALLIFLISGVFTLISIRVSRMVTRWGLKFIRLAMTASEAKHVQLAANR